MEVVARPVIPGDLLVVFSGGNCPGGEALLRAMFDRADMVRKYHGINFRILGARAGFGILNRGDTSCLTELCIDNIRPVTLWDALPVSFGKSGPSGNYEECLAVVRLLVNEGIRYVAVWGGNFSLWSASVMNRAAEQVAREEGPDKLLRIGCLPKSIDNDLGLALKYWTIGFSTASRALAEQVQNLARDAQASNNIVYIPVLHGNQMGHLTLRTAQLAGCPLYLIPEQFPGQVPLGVIADIIIGALVKGASRARPRYHSVVPVAEGIIRMLISESCLGLEDARARAREGVTASNFPFVDRFTEAMEVAAKDLVFPNNERPRFRLMYQGYTARGAQIDGIDRQLIELLGRKLIEHLFRGHSGFLMAGTGNEPEMLPISSMCSSDGRVLERAVDISTDGVVEHWLQGASYRLLPEDLASPEVEVMAAMLRLTRAEFVTRFRPVADWGRIRI